ncbi:MAG: GntR family transcriptional regulator [Candidatus Onthomonas sp.]
MPWNFATDAPIYLQAAEVIRLRILTGAYPPGSSIPSVRELAQEAAVNPNTMQKALTLLESTGLLYTQRTAGRRVTESRELIHCLRLEQAHTHIDHCRGQLAALGFSPEEIHDMLQNWTEPAVENEKE